MKSALKSFNNANHWSFNFSFILWMPNIMSNEFFNCSFPIILKHRFIIHNFQLIHQSINILNKNIISSDKNFFLLLIYTRILRCLWNINSWWTSNWLIRLKLGLCISSSIHSSFLTIWNHRSRFWLICLSLNLILLV